MFGWKVITIAVVWLFSSGFFMQYFMTRRKLMAADLVALSGVISSTYCLLAGLYLLDAWQSPFIYADTETILIKSANLGLKSIILFMSIHYWPYVLIGLGGLFLYLHGRLLVG